MNFKLPQTLVKSLREEKISAQLFLCSVFYTYIGEIDFFQTMIKITKKLICCFKIMQEFGCINKHTKKSLKRKWRKFS